MRLDDAGEAVAALYRAAVGYQTTVLDDLVEGADLGWKCRAPLGADEGRECLYMNVTGNEERDWKCANCGAPRPEASS